MKRREALVLLGSTTPFAGCRSVEPSDSDTTSTATSQTEVETGAEEPCPEIEIEPDRSDSDGFPTIRADIETGRDVDGVQVRSGIVKQPSAESPGRLRVHFQNRRSETTPVEFGTIPPFSEVWVDHVAGDSLIVLSPDPAPELLSGSESPETPSNGCWVAETNPAPPDYFESREVEPCEAVEQEYGILAAEGSSDCPEDGKYTASSDFRFLERETETDEAAYYTTELTLTIRR